MARTVLRARAHNPLSALHEHDVRLGERAQDVLDGYAHTRDAALRIQQLGNINGHGLDPRQLQQAGQLPSGELDVRAHHDEAVPQPRGGAGANRLARLHAHASRDEGRSNPVDQARPRRLGVEQTQDQGVKVLALSSIRSRDRPTTQVREELGDPSRPPPPAGR